MNEKNEKKQEKKCERTKNTNKLKLKLKLNDNEMNQDIGKKEVEGSKKKLVCMKLFGEDEDQK